MSIPDDEIDVETKKLIGSSIIIQENTSIKNLPAIFWLTCLFATITYGYIAPFSFISSGFLTDYFFTNMSKSDAQTKAGIYLSIPAIISVIFVPIFGWLVDSFGKRAYLTFLSSFLGLMTFVSFFFFKEPIFGFIIFGTCTSLTSTIVWNILALVVKGDHIVI